VIYRQINTIFGRDQRSASSLLNLHEVNDIRHTETLSPEPPVPEPTAFEGETNN